MKLYLIISSLLLSYTVTCSAFEAEDIAKAYQLQWENLQEYAPSLCEQANLTGHKCELLKEKLAMLPKTTEELTRIASMIPTAGSQMPMSDADHIGPESDDAAEASVPDGENVRPHEKKSGADAASKKIREEEL